jgi:DNA polymerase III subunit beta
MKFSVSKDKLLEGLSTVQNVVSTRTTLPILSNVLLQASDGKIRLTTTDLDVGIRRSVEAQVERTRATTLPARRLFSIVTLHTGLLISSNLIYLSKIVEL